MFVGNLPVNTKEKQLKTYFEPFGKVKSVRLRSQMGKIIFKKSMVAKDPCITAYVVFEDQEGAENAVDKCEKKFKDRRLRVTLAGQKKGINRKTIFVGNLSYATVDDDLHEVFSTCGEVESIRTIRGPSGCKGIAYVTFKEKSALALALQLAGTRIRDRPIRLEKCRDQEKAERKTAKKEEEKNTKVIHKFVNGKHVPVVQNLAPPQTPSNAGNALKRLQKKPGFNSDQQKSGPPSRGPPGGRPQSSGPPGRFQNRGPPGRPQNRGPPGQNRGPPGRPQNRGPPGQNRGPPGRPGQNRGPPGRPGQDGEKGPRKPGYKPKAPKQKGLPKNIQLAKKLNVNWKKPTYKAGPKKPFNSGPGASSAPAPFKRTFNKPKPAAE